MRRIVCIFVAVMAVVSAVSAQTKLNVDVTVGWGGCYRPGEWTPVDILIHHKLTKPLGGVLRITAQQDSMSTRADDAPRRAEDGRTNDPRFLNPDESG